MEIKKIIYITHFIFSRRDYERFGIEIMKKNGFSIEVWDFTPFLSPEVYKTLKVPDPINYKKYNIKLFKGNEEIKDQMECFKNNAMVVFLTIPDYRIYPVFRRLLKLGIPYALSIPNSVPSFKNTGNSFSIFNNKRLFHFFKKIREINVTKLKKRISNILMTKYLGINFPKFILAGGTQTLINYNPPIGKKTKIVWGHSFDYDLYLRDLSKSSKNDLKSKEYAVFIDGYWPFAHDYAYMGVKNPVTPERYYRSLCKFFNKVEKEMGFKVIIAAHPSSMYEKHPDYYESRSVIRGKTMELIRDAEFVLMHYSTSINFAVLFNKPVIFFTTDELEDSIIDAKYVRAFSSALGKRFINIDNDYETDWIEELMVNKKIYSIYKERYIKKRGTEEKPFWQIVADEIKNFK